MARSVVVKTPANTVTGYGNDGVGLSSAFVRKGWDVHLSPTSVHVPIPMTIAHLLTKEPAPPYDLLINHIDPQQVGLTEGDRKVAAVAVAWTMWEWDTYHPKGHTRFVKELKPFDVLACYDPVTFEALSPVAVKAKVETVTVQGGFEPGDWPYVGNREWFNTPFRFCMVGQLGPRKNPFAAVEAFAILKEKYGDKFDAELHLKTSVSNTFHPAMLDTYPWLKLHVTVWSQRQLLDFYANMHCLLAPSHGEGKNMPCLEAQSTGIPVIATGWGGHTMWQSPDYGYVIPYTLAQYRDQGQWATPDVNVMADLMWEAYSDRGTAREKGRIASQVIPAMCSWDAVVDNFLTKLRSVGVTI